MTIKIYDWDSCPNIKLTDDCVIWWNEEEICIDTKLVHKGLIE